MNLKKKKERGFASSFGSSRTVNLSRILPCGIQILYLRFVIQLQPLGRGYYQNLNFSFLGQVFQYYLLDFKACWLRFASFGISAQVLKLGFLSLYLLFTIIILWETTKVPLKKKEIWMLLWASLFLGKWCGVDTYFLYKYIYIYIYMKN